MALKIEIEMLESIKKSVGIDHFWSSTSLSTLKVIDLLNEEAYQFGKDRDFKKGWYTLLQKEAIWKMGKLAVFLNKTGNRECVLWCCFCDKEINYYRSNRYVLHHEEYVWKELFNPKYVRFAHYSCHKKYHN